MRDIVVYGLGQLGQLFGSAALRAGLRVTPITRSVDPQTVLTSVPAETPVIVAVGEDALAGVLAQLGARPVILLQNELFPAAWQGHPTTPTVMVPWLLKKQSAPLTVPRPTQVFGAQAELVGALHAALSIACEPLPNEAALHQALVDKYAFIVTINALGLLRDRTLAVWLAEDPLRVRALAEEAATLGERLCAASIDRERSVQAVLEGMRGLGSMSARGRTARSRIDRAWNHAERLGVSVPELRAI
ncbi:MAG TPA: hypothetical protein VFX59_19940 [Polyangiales bacterium]|nr:hypothetical protein [Polyangiales bacterium]